MRLHSRLVSSLLLAAVLLALVAGSALAQIVVQPSTGGNRLVATGSTGRTGASRGWYASLLPGRGTNLSLRLPGWLAVVPTGGVTKRVAR